MTEKRKSIKVNLIWKLLERGCSQGITLIITVILARILEPEEFGTIALMLVLINLLQVFTDSGMGSALIQKKDVRDVDYSTALYFNIFLCIAVYGLIYLLAPAIAEYYHDVNLTSVVRVMCTIVLISGMKNIQMSRVAVKMEFQKSFYATSIGTFISGCIGILMAYRGFGIWALVFSECS